MVRYAYRTAAAISTASMLIRSSNLSGRGCVRENPRSSMLCGPIGSSSASGATGIEQLLSSTSRVDDSVVEGLVVRRESDGFTTARAKLVRAEFVQAIDDHWSRRPLRRNELA